MSATTSPSPIVQVFVDYARESFPPDQQARLDGYGASVAGTTSTADPYRAKRCVDWAIEHADDKEQAHPWWAELRERLHAWREESSALGFGVVGPQGTERHPIVDFRIRQVEAAVDVAVRLGEEDGWDHSPWGTLLDELIEMEERHPDEA
jgi:hypothetical protein